MTKFKLWQDCTQSNPRKGCLCNNKALNILQWETLKERRQILFHNLSHKSLKLVQSIIKAKNKEHIINKRKICVK